MEAPGVEAGDKPASSSENAPSTEDREPGANARERSRTRPVASLATADLEADLRAALDAVRRALSAADRAGNASAGDLVYKAHEALRAALETKKINRTG